MRTDSVSTHSLRVAAQIRAEVARHRLPRSKIAAALDVSTAAVSRRLLGQVPMTVGEVGAIADLLGTSTTQLLHGTDERAS